ncbi:MAG: glycosyl transferase family 1 [Chloroflexi bacterium]|nr:MAG: glycosyl transferase family 1 [Chloroflexota bacterium]
MHVVMVSKALVAGAYQRKAEAIAASGVELTVLVPPVWRDRRGAQVASPDYTTGYTLRTLPIRFNGNFHLHYYPTLGHELARLRPDLLHMDEEPYNLATYLGLVAAQRLNIPALFFTWQNISRSYPPPFAWFEQANYRAAAYALAGNQEAADVLRRKGYGGPLAVFPQFGVDPLLFQPAAQARDLAAPLRIGYAGGLLPEKGVDLLLRACAGLQGAWQLHIVGDGSERAALETLARHLDISERVRLEPRLPARAMPAYYQSLDVLVLPSRTRSNWKEQFGRVLIEAMACEVAVIGSTTGEIARVIGDAGLLFPEADVDALCAQLQRLMDDPARRGALAARGRERVLAQFTMDSIAASTVAVYRAILAA